MVQRITGRSKVSDREQKELRKNDNDKMKITTVETSVSEVSWSFPPFSIGLFESETHALENSHLRSVVFFFLYFIKSLKAFL